MITRVSKWKRPRGSALLAIVASILVAAGLLAATALALVSDTGSYNVEVESKDFSSGLVLLDGDASSGSVEYIGSSAANESSGTGIFDPFLRLQGDPTQRGYNTDGPVAFETKSGRWTKAILASAIPIVNCVIDEIGTTGQCWEIFVDINESNTAKYVSLNEVEVWFTTNPNLVGYVEPGGFPSGATQQYDFSGEILIHDVNQGSGRGDLRYLIPVTSFTAADYFVLFSKWGTTTTTAPDGKTYASEGGFEEWKVRKAPNLSIVKTADAASVNAGQNIGFTITVTNNGVADATGVTISDPLPGGPGIDWSESPDNPNCSISTSGTPPVETLNCGPVTLAAGGGSLSVHVQSATTGASCGTYNNTASFTSTNAGSGSASASTSVNCAAIKILKQSTKTDAGGNPVLVANEGAVFSITGPGGYANSVTDDNAAGVEDEDTTIGEVCISGLAPGAYTVNETTPPTGYGGATQTNVTATATAGTNCTDAQPTSGVAVFTNPPLGEFIINFNDLGSGETSAKIDCTGLTPTPADATPTDHDDDTETYTNLPGGNPAIVYACTISVDP